MAVERMENTDGQCPGLDVHLDSKVASEQAETKFFSLSQSFTFLILSFLN